MGNILPFALGMLLTSYGAAMVTHGVYSQIYTIGWTLFALCSPVFAWFAWLTKERGIFPKLIRVGILLVSVLSSVVLFDGFRIYDWIINALLIYFLFFKRIER